MKHYLIGLIAIVYLMTVACTPKVATVTQKPIKENIMKNDIDSLSYSLGILIGQNLTSQGFDSLNTEALAMGLSDIFNDTAKISIEEANSFVGAYQEEASKRQFAKNIEIGKQFLAENAKRAEVTTTASGLQYEVLTEGTGSKPKATNNVTVHYEGRLLDGTIFDSSVQRGEPASFGLNQVIKGWTEGVQLMSTGAKYRFYIPYDLAYGERGAGQQIGPFSTLIFDVELISFK